ncbi:MULTISPECIES: hypothetical protein [Pseudomonas]|uniref:hypothetical protein n=1 Tax=Pseudomonas TaxID=286 RepID=UPI000CD35418|nr:MULTISPECIES: hypothetical protein [Pseudomonas]BBN63572.1 hypothetical protein KUIN1_27620 [Pseudomonas sp. KUIN-1]SOP99282.1 hypothetical protein CFBP2118_02421 [Pseudomonas syringae pv. syringae]
MQKTPEIFGTRIEDLSGIETQNDCWHYSDFLKELFGDEWHYPVGERAVERTTNTIICCASSKPFTRL